MNGNNRKSIKFQLRITFAILIVAPIVVLGVYAYIVARNNLIAQTKIAMQGNVDVIAYGIENNIKNENDVIKFFSYETDFRKVLQHVDRDPYALTESLNDRIEPLIWYYLSSDTNISDIHIYSTLLQQDHIGDFTSIPETAQELAWYEECKKEYSAMWVVDGEGGVYVIKTLLDVATSSQVIGMITLKIDTDQFFSILNQASYLSNGIYVLNDNDEIIIHKATDSEAVDKGVLENITAGTTEQNAEKFSYTQKYFLLPSETISNGWTVYYYIDRSDITTDVFGMLRTVIVIALIIFLLSYSFANIFARNLSRRVTGLNKLANEVKHGNFEVSYSDAYEDEISQLADSMNSMASKLKEMMDEINRRNEEDLKLKESDIHYREWLFDFVVERNNDVLAVLNTESYAPDFVTANVEATLGIPLDKVKEDIRVLSQIQLEDERFKENVKISDKIQESMRTGEIIVMDELKFEHKQTNEHLYYRGVIVSTIDDGGKRLAIALYDRTQEFRRNHQLQEALQAAETANKAKTSFLANMSHDFRTPMNAITGFNLLIDKNCNDPEKVREYTHKISLASHNLLGLLNDVLDMSKIESGKTTLDIQEMRMGQLLEEVNTVIGMQAKSKNQDYIINANGLIHDRFMGDKQRINEILVNILGNAVKYTQEGGRIEFTIQESTTSSEGFNNVRFIISDNGIGMKPEYKDKIFDAFSREEKGATKTIQGTGLGMAITKSLVELMGGTIRVDSEEGKGSTFTVNLRLQLAGENEIYWKDNGIKYFLGVNGNIEENVFFRERMKAAELEGDVATSAGEALRYIEEFEKTGRHLDFIIIDDDIEDMPITDLIKAIRAGEQGRKGIIFVAVINKSEVEKPLIEAGATKVVQKPIMEYTFKQAFDEMAQGRADAEAKAAENTNPLDGMKFLAAEDNDINADILIELMDMEGAAVTRGVNGQEVVEMFKNAHEGDYDMILMDIQMPVMNGYEAAAAIRALGTDWSQKIPIIAMTANAYADDVQQAFDAGMNAHVTKPIDIRIVEKTILEFKK